MSEEFKIPPDLVFFEHQLRALPVEDSGIDRDETFYQAGWSAALSSGDSMKKGVHWCWPATTSVLATVAAVLLIIVSQQQNFIASVDEASGATALNRSRVEIQQARVAGTQDHVAFPWSQSDFEERMAKSQLTTLSYRLDLPSELLPQRDLEFDVATPKSTKQLLEELAPRNENKIEIDDRKRVWDWFSQKVGEVI